MNFICALCCKNTPSTASALLVRCNHKSCKECMIKWIEKQETSGQNTPPTCPYCRLKMTEKEIPSILGRQFQSQAIATLIDESETMDELTLQWFNAHTRQCEHCGSHIEKREGSCDMMECLCGYRFCYQCGAQGARCSCSSDEHCFWDNALNRPAVSFNVATVAARDMVTGNVNLRRHIEQRKGRRVHDQREIRNRRREKEERNIVDFSARWLFLPENTANRILKQEGRANMVHRIRANRRIREEQERREITDLSAKWLWLNGPSYSDLYSSGSEDAVPNSRSESAVIDSGEDYLLEKKAPICVRRRFHFLPNRRKDQSHNGRRFFSFKDVLFGCHLCSHKATDSIGSEIAVFDGEEDYQLDSTPPISEDRSCISPSNRRREQSGRSLGFLSQKGVLSGCRFRSRKTTDKMGSGILSSESESAQKDRTKQCIDWNVHRKK